MPPLSCIFCVKSLQLCPTLCDLWTVAHHAPLSVGFFRQEYWSGLLCPPPGDPPDPGIEPTSLTSAALAGLLRLLYWQVGALPQCHLGSPLIMKSYVCLYSLKIYTSICVPIPDYFNYCNYIMHVNIIVLVFPNQFLLENQFLRKNLAYLFNRSTLALACLVPLYYIYRLIYGVLSLLADNSMSFNLFSYVLS